MGFTRDLIYRIKTTIASWFGIQQTEAAATSFAEVEEKTKELKVRMDLLADQEWCIDALTHDYMMAAERLRQTEVAYNVARATVAKRKLEKRLVKEQADVTRLRYELRKLTDKTKVDIQEANDLASWLENVQFGKRGPRRWVRKASSWLNR
ncbi:hypothetical protein [Exiguobacterium sp. s181]|uniref:hypothetical protein n=1 Tax=Exiguobacterium sp. s181 TaxID=2751288 RepID=UPI001BECAD9C|nr:hypothetical protein [Exiguobacterium sp. s181]